jgi:hypothetical protein
MGREAFDFLERSVLWSLKDPAANLDALTDQDLKIELSNYRQHVLNSSLAPAPA